MWSLQLSGGQQGSAGVRGGPGRVGTLQVPGGQQGSAGRGRRAQTAREVPQSFYQWLGDTGRPAVLRPLLPACRMLASFLGRHPKHSSRCPATAFGCFFGLHGQHAHGSCGPWPTQHCRERAPVQARISPERAGQAKAFFPLSSWFHSPAEQLAPWGHDAGCGVSCTAPGCWRGDRSSCSGGASVQSSPGSALHTAPAAQPAVSGAGGPPPPRPPEPVAQRLQAESGGRLLHWSVQDQQGLKRQGRDREAAVICLSLKGWDGKEQNRGQSPDLWGPQNSFRPGPPPPPPPSSSHGQEGGRGAGISRKVLASNAPHAPEISLCSAHTAPHPRREQSPPQLGQGLELPTQGLSSSLPAPADTPVPSLTVVDDLELLLAPVPQLPPDEP